MNINDRVRDQDGREGVVVDKVENPACGDGCCGGPAMYAVRWDDTTTDWVYEGVDVEVIDD